jgi:hypothetical protein
MLRHSRVATTTYVYMQTSEEGVRSTVRLRQGSENFSAGEERFKGGVVPVASLERKEPAITHPVRGKVLQFATKLRMVDRL